MPFLNLVLQVTKFQTEADGYKASSYELQRGLDTLHEARTTSAVEKEYIDTIRRMAVVQVRAGRHHRTHSPCAHSMKGQVWAGGRAPQNTLTMCSQHEEAGPCRWVGTTGHCHSCGMAALS